ncbi:oligosaccharide flippase family protein [Pararoseomonas sp. SCSIO 73927]|uniref:oligosaccharide flippase family protein n=1 Tax=Pararoseomonas sp. SCSIO 73927 TaxID=3114537 RepID=UPI0030D27FBC
MVEGGSLTVLSLVALVVFARLLTPAEVGLAALALGVVQLLNLPVEMLFHDALVQRRSVEDRHFDAAFTASAGMGLLMAGLCWAAEPLLGGVVDGSLPLVLAWMSLSLPASGLASALVARSRREFRFRSLAARSLIARAVSFLAGIALAFADAGVWAMVAQHLLQVWLSAVVLWLGAPDRPRLRVAPAETRELAGFGGTATGALIVEWAVHRLLTLQIGAALGLEAAGQFSLASRVVDMLRATVAGALVQPALPLMARLQERHRALRALWSGATELTCAITFPLFAGLAAVAPAMVAAVFGPGWAPAAPLVAVLSVAAMLTFARLYAVPALTALGRPRAVLGVRLAEVPALLAIPLLGPGLVGATAVYAWRALLALPVEVWALRGAAGLSALRQARGLPALALLAGVMGVAVHLLGAGLAGWPPAIVLAVQVAAGAVLWFVLLGLARRVLLRRLVRVVTRLVGRG